MENNNLKDYYELLEEFITIYRSIQHILLVSLNDVFFTDILKVFRNDPLIIDTIEILIKNKFNLDDIFKVNNNTENKFSNIFGNINKLLQHKLIKKYEFINNKENKRNTKKSQKKSYEVDVLSQYLIDLFQKVNIKNIFEMGCGKSYLTDDIIISDDMLYIGIDKKDDLIEKQTKIINKHNSYVLNYFVDVNNFSEIYDKEISPLMTNRENTNFLLFGLHSCGNLTSDSLKLFVKKDKFNHLVIIGCCLNLLKEYISPEARNEQLFMSYIENIGYDNKGNCLEHTLLYDYNFDEVGYPLSDYITTNHKNLFLTRTVRNSSMQSLPRESDIVIDSKNNLFYKKFLFRTMLQAFFEKFCNKLKFFYGFGKIDINLNDKFNVYLDKVLTNLQKKSGDEVVQELRKIDKDEIDNHFAEDYLQYENILWAVYVIRLKFSRIVEYIIALDRIIYLIENGITNLELVKIFDEAQSVRNLLIYASK